MTLNLERRLRLNTEIEHRSLYTWAVNEIDADGRVGTDQIPWPWNLRFVGTSAVAAATLDASDGSDFGRAKPPAPTVTRRGIIRVTLEPKTPMSMFGTSRTIEAAFLEIVPSTNYGDEVGCTAWGCPSYTHEVDFRDETTADTLTFTMTVAPEDFAAYFELVTAGRVDHVELRVGGLAGAYSEWSPSIETDLVKVLAADQWHVVDVSASPTFEPPRLGPVGSALVAFRRTLKLVG